MNTDPKTVALRFNECISRHDLGGLTKLMTEDHVFIDREEGIFRSRESMSKAWEEFFRMFPLYRNIFSRVESRGNTVIMLGYAFWSEENPHDPAIWKADIDGGQVAEWHIYYDTESNRKKFGLD